MLDVRTLFAIVAILGGCAAPAGPAESFDPALAPREGFSSSGKADIAGGRSEFVEDEITHWNTGLADADRAAKYERMADSPFGFFRGTNHLFWADFANDPRLGEYGDEDTTTWVQGDLHGANYGAFTDDGGEIVYDLNDFDESIVADYQLDLWRMATSIVLVAWDNGLSEADAQTAVEAFAESYLDRLRDVRGNDGELDSEWALEDAYGRLDELLEDVEADEGRAHLLGRWTTMTSEGRRLDLADDDLGPIDDAVRGEIVGALPAYGETLSGGLDYDEAYFRVLDVARRLNAGTGSLGTPRYYVLIEGLTDADDDDVVLDVKQQNAPSGYAYLGADARLRYDSAFENHAERAAVAQRALLTDVDDHLGWMQLELGAYGVRERTPHREGFPLEDLNTDTRLRKLAEQWGTILATDHARADRDFREDLVPTSFDREVDERTDGDHEGFRALTWDVARTYADQVLEDYSTFLSMIDR